MFVKKDFPILANTKNIYLDSASTTQKPQKVIDAMRDFMSCENANIHRGAYNLSEMASQKYLDAKKAVAKILNAHHHEIIFTYNATYAYNFLSRTLIKSGILATGDTVLISQMEHHANIVAWQILAEEYGIVIEWVKITDEGLLDYGDLEKKLPNAKIFSISGASNVTGEIVDLPRIQKMRESLENPPLWIVDASQRFPHFTTDVASLDIDIFVATAHKILADTGLGIIFLKKSLQKILHPAFCGGGAINWVTTQGYEPAGLPFRFEPGTPHIIGAVSLLAALEYIESIGGFSAIENYEKSLVRYIFKKCENLPKGVRLVGEQTENRLGVFSFAFADHHPHDVAEYLADKNICVRSGHHCTEPLHRHL